MNCPACDRLLQPFKAGTLSVDVCAGGCGGIWFDAFEMHKVDEYHEPAGEVLLDIPHDSVLEVDHDRRRNCPRCETVVMMRHAHRDNPMVKVDECPECGGCWLDDGVLAQIYDESRLQAGAGDTAERAARSTCGWIRRASARPSARTRRRGTPR